MNTKFVIRGFLIALPLTVVAIVVGFVLIIARTPIGQPPGPTPLPPTILAPRGEMPAGPVGLQEWAKYRGGWAGPGSGFLIVLDSLSESVCACRARQMTPPHLTRCRASRARH